jgi:hypothetical protein
VSGFLLVVEMSFERQNGQTDGAAGAVAELASDTDFLLASMRTEGPCAWPAGLSKAITPL